MYKGLLIAVIISAFFSQACVVDDAPSNLPENEVSFINGTKLIFVSKEEARILMGTSDEYSQVLTRYDIASRTSTPSNDQEHQYLEFAAAQAQEWNENEIEVLKIKINKIKDRIETLGLKLDFPTEIKLVKSTLKEEGKQISYTRTNYIVLRGDVTEDFVIHELFHILTRYNPETRDELYKTINFYKSNRITYPEAIVNHVVTNPDGPFLEHTIRLTIEGKEKEAVIILYTGKDYDGGSFFDEMQRKLMIVEGPPNDKKPVLVNGQPLLFDLTAATDFKDKTGRNTNYTLHPEEILADHFMILVKPKPASDPAFIDAMKAALTK